MDEFVRRIKAIGIGGKYHLLRKLGSGSFGNVYLGMALTAAPRLEMKTHFPVGRDAVSGDEVAIKLEDYRVAPSLLREEADIYRSLAGKPGFPKVYWFGQQHDFMALVFELLGPNLEDLFRYCGNQFSLKTTLMLADQLLRRIQILHSNNYLHRDIKPENFLLGTGQQGNVVYMTDLGLAIYRHPDRWSSSSPPIRVTTRPPELLGTCRYASIKGHLGIGR
jgi:serine/threonine protein kinase